MIELGKNADMPNVSGAVMFHSTESGRFMAAGRQETAEFLAAVKRGEFDHMVEQNRCGYCSDLIFLVGNGWKHLIDKTDHEATPANLSSAPPAQEVTP